MACSVCGRTGHKKPNCPVVKEEAKEQQQQLITILQTIPLILSNPFIQAFLWYQLSKMSPKVNLLNNVIATAEIVPTVDLNVPKGVVLGAMLDKTEDTINLWNDVKDFMFDFPLPDIPSEEEIEEFFTLNEEEAKRFIESLEHYGESYKEARENPVVDILFEIFTPKPFGRF